MSFLAIILGSIRFPDGGAAEWRAEAIVPDDFDDWPDDANMFGAPAVAPTVQAMLDAAAALGAPGDPSYLEARTDGDREVIAGTLVGDERCLQWHTSIATMLRAAGEAGGVGTAAIVLPMVGGATVITLGDDDSSVELVPIQQVFADEALATIAVANEGWLTAKRTDPSLARAVFRDGEARFWLGAPTAAEDAALAAARALPDAALAAALDDRMVLAPGLEPLRTRTPDVAALRAALDAGTPLARTIAIELVGAHDPAAAEPLAVALLDHPSRYVVRMATRALAGAGGDAALDGLLRVLLEHATEWSSASEALTRVPHAQAAARLAALLERDAALDPMSVAEDARAATVERARRVIEAAGARRDPLLRDGLLARFDDPRSRWIVPRIVAGLANQGGPAVEARGQELQLAMMGMGKALNQDVARRAQLLAIEHEEDSGGIIRFDDLELATLRTLLDEGFIHPEARQNDAPSTADFFHLMTQWPELRATGYAVSHARPDYRVHIDGVSVALDGLDPARATALREGLEPLTESATNVEMEDDHVALWWT